MPAVFLPKAYSSVKSLAFCLVLSLTAAAAQPEQKKEPPRQVCTVSLWYRAAFYSPQIPEGQLTAPAGGFSEWMPCGGSSKLELYQNPPDSEGRFHPEDLVLSVSMPDSPRTLLVFYRDNEKLAAKAFAAPSFDAGAVTLLNFSGHLLDYDVNGTPGRIDVWALKNVTAKGGHSGKIPLSVRPADSKADRPVINARLRTLAGYQPYVFLIPVWNDEGALVTDSLAVNVIYRKPEKDPNRRSP